LLQLCIQLLLEPTLDSLFAGFYVTCRPHPLWAVLAASSCSLTPNMTEYCSLTPNNYSAYIANTHLSVY
jgi:hypothetical protein